MREVKLNGARYKITESGTVFRWSKVGTGVSDWKRVPSTAVKILAAVRKA